MIDTKNPCTGGSNWKASSNASGGTPGKKNSADAINPDKNPPAFTRLYVLDSVTIVAVFDESLDSNEAALPQHYLIEKTGEVASQALVMPPLFNEVQLSFDKPLLQGRIYQLKLSGLKDCSQNAIAGMVRRPVGIPDEAESLDLVINELLFNPKDEGVDYVELLNRSNKVIEASGIYIANRNSSGQISTPRKISEVPLLIFPGDYITLSEDVAKIQLQFVIKNQDCLFQMSTLPSLPDDRGNVIVFNQQGKTVDELRYDEGWHFALLRNREGIALERIDPGKPTQSKDNWMSASSASGYGTPTYRNSQYKEAGNSNGTIAILHPFFSPDNDGLDDICFIHYEMSEPNYVANILIFDLNGQMLRRLYSNATLSQSGYLRWDGLGEGGRSLSAGIYIIYTEIFNLGGKSKRFKNVVTLAKKF